MILQQRSLLIPQTLRNILPLLLRQHHPIKAIINHMIIMERTRILRQRINLSAQRAPRPAVDGMAVRGAVDVRARRVDRGVNHVGGGVEEAAFAAVNDLARVVYEDEVGFVD